MPEAMKPSGLVMPPEIGDQSEDAKRLKLVTPCFLTIYINEL